MYSVPGIHRTDKLFDTLALLDEDVEDMLLPRLAAQGISWQEIPNSLSTLSLNTVEDYVRFLSELAHLRR